jgi:hypothetical protein
MWKLVKVDFYLTKYQKFILKCCHSIRFGQLLFHIECEANVISIAINHKNTHLIESWLNQLNNFVDLPIIENLLYSKYHSLITFIHKKGLLPWNTGALRYFYAIKAFDTVIYLIENNQIPPKSAVLAQLACNSRKIENIDKVAIYCDYVTLVQAAQYIGEKELLDYIFKNYAGSRPRFDRISDKQFPK